MTNKSRKQKTKQEHNARRKHRQEKAENGVKLPQIVGKGGEAEEPEFLPHVPEDGPLEEAPIEDDPIKIAFRAAGLDV